MLQVSEYVKEWLQYQNLWDMQAERLYEKLGNNIQTWQVCLRGSGCFDQRVSRDIR